MIPAVRWEGICKRAGRTVLTVELQRVRLLDFPDNQLSWAMGRYTKDTLYPNLPDFEEWLGKQELPEDLVCAAYLTEEPEIVKLADDLETLLGAWFPGTEEEEQIEELRRRLGAVLL